MILNPYIFFHEYYVVGGTTTMTAHLLHGLDIPNKVVFMKGNKCSNFKDFGFGIKKMLVPVDIIDNCQDIFIMQIDPPIFERIQDKLVRDDITFILHDLTGFDGKNPLYNFLKKMFSGNGKKWKIITIRQTMQKWMKEKEQIDNEFIHHPWYDFPIRPDLKKNVDSLDKTGACAITRLSYNKRIDIMFDANDMMPENHKNLIDLHGMQQSSILNYHILKPERLKKYWKGKKFVGFDATSEILSKKKFVVNLTKLKYDGGGTEYSTMEAIHHNCGVILHRDWISKGIENIGHSVWEEGYNCFAISSAQELKDLLIKDPDTDDIVKNAKSILDEPRQSLKQWAQYVK